MNRLGKDCKGFSIAYLVIGMTVILGFISFSVDYARILVAKTELHSAVDSAVRAAAAAVTSGVTAAQDAAVQYAALNKCDGSPVVLDPNNDVEFGMYDRTTKTFTVLTGSARSGANALRITARRTVARGNPLHLLFAQIVGIPTKDLTESAIAVSSTFSSTYIGLTLTRMYDTSRFDGYDSSKGAYSAAAATPATLYAGTDLILANYSYVYGKAFYVGTLTKDSTSIQNPGPVSKMSQSPLFSPVSLGNVATVNDNAKLSSTYYKNNQLNMGNNKGTYTAPAGTYYFTSFQVGTGSTLLFSGPTTIYLTNGGKIQGTVAPASYKPPELMIRATGGDITIDPGVYYGAIYNPVGETHHHNGGQSYGGVVSLLLCFRQTSQGHADAALTSTDVQGIPGQISVVK